MKTYLFLMMMFFVSSLYSAPYILVGSGIYSSGRCEVFFLSDEESKKLWIISFPKNEGEASPINDLVANQENYASMGEIVDLAAKGFSDLKGFKLFISSMNIKVNYSVTTKTHSSDFVTDLSCQ